MKFEYAAEGGLRYPVRPGQVWQLGPHLVACADHEAGALDHLEALLPEPQWSCYVDPPWDNGNAKAFRTKAQLDSEGLEIGPFLDRLVTHTIGAFAMALEMGTRNLEFTQALLARAGWPHLTTYPTEYSFGGPPRPAWLILCTRQRIPITGTPLEAGTDAPGWFIDNFPTPRVLDPCGGLGLTGQAAARRGVPSSSIELHPNRCSAALTKLARLYRRDPVLTRLQLPHPAA